MFTPSEGGMPTCYIVGMVDQEGALIASFLGSLGFYVERYDFGNDVIDQCRIEMPDSMMINAGDGNGSRAGDLIDQIRDLGSLRILVFATDVSTSNVTCGQLLESGVCMEQPIFEQDLAGVFDLQILEALN